MIVLDTSALIRFFTKDIPADAKKVKDLLISEKNIKIPDVVFPELEYVLLGKTYGISKNKLIQIFKFLVTEKNIKVSSEIKIAVEIFKNEKLDIADCIIAASSINGKLFSFDKVLIKTVSNLKK